VAIIGAGMAGASCARALADRGVEAVVYDKGKVAGGRLAARWAGQSQWDYGAQYLTARDDRFRRVVDAWSIDGMVQRWVWDGSPQDDARPSGEKGVRWVGAPTMREPSLALLAGIDVHLRSTVERLRAKPDGWCMDGVDADGLRFSTGTFSWVVCTAPAPQAAELLRDVAPSLHPSIARARMAPTWALLIHTAAPVPSRPGPLACGEPIDWLVADDMKPGRCGSGRHFVAHTSSAWSESHVDRSPEEVARVLHSVVSDALGLPRDAVDLHAHRWRYARVTQPAGVPCLVDRTQGIAAAGDWCIDGRVESAYLSGLAAASAVLRDLS
jgi:renalase